ncbi:MAG TPA: periplasmic heavy metal sensor [Methylomirabilota bacterium]|jgi:Spy/CpxP family protein refolding chaperone
MKKSRGIFGMIVSVIASGLLAAGAGSPVFAQSSAPPAGSPAPGPGLRWGLGPEDGELTLMVRTAGLTPEQHAKVRAILTAHRAGMRSLVDQLRQAQQELGAKLLSPGQVQPADIQPQLQRIGQLRDQLAQGSAQAALDVRAVLTPEQLARVAQARERLKQLRDEMRQIIAPARP